MSANNNETAYVLRLGQLDAFIVSQEISDLLTERCKTAKVKGVLDSYGMTMIVSTEAIEILNKISREKLIVPPKGLDSVTNDTQNVSDCHEKHQTNTY